jgi:hypothetical protein
VSQIDPSTLSPIAQKVLSPQAPAPMRMLAAKAAMLGVQPGDALTLVVALLDADDPAVATQARATLDALPAPVLQGALRAQLIAPVIDALAERYGRDEEVLPRLLGMELISTETLERLANQATERIGELIATNEVLLLAHPTVIEKLYMNRAVRMSTADRLIDLAVRNGIELAFPAFKEAAQAIQNELIPEPTLEPTYDDILFRQTEAVSQQTPGEDEDVCDENEEGQEEVKEKFLPLFAQIQNMTISQKIRRAMLGNGAERMLLVRDTNRLVAEAAAKSPRMTEPEAVRISASRAVSDEVLRIIATNREFVRSYQIKMNLVANPRTPFTFASRLIPHLRENDLKNLARSKNVPANVVTTVRQQLMRKKR